MCYQVLKYVLNYEVVLPKQADYFCCSHLLLLFSPALLNLITLWITTYYVKYVYQCI